MTNTSKWAAVMIGLNIVIGAASVTAHAADLLCTARYGGQETLEIKHQRVSWFRYTAGPEDRNAKFVFRGRLVQIENTQWIDEETWALNPNATVVLTHHIQPQIGPSDTTADLDFRDRRIEFNCKQESP